MIEQKRHDELRKELSRWIHHNQLDALNMLHWFIKRINSVGGNINMEGAYIGLIPLLDLSYESTIERLLVESPELNIAALHRGLLIAIESGDFTDDFMKFLKKQPDSFFEKVYKEMLRMMKLEAEGK
jgi:hypothetical protein